MPQADKYRDRIVPIEFSETEELEKLPYAGRLTLVLITKGCLRYELNGRAYVADAPALLFISESDDIRVLNKKHFSAKSFSFAPTFINSSLTFEALAEGKFTCIEDQHDRNVLFKFLARNDYYTGVLKLENIAYMQIFRWLDFIGEEIYVQSDMAWTCRIRRWLLQILYLSDDVMSIGKRADPEDVAAEYMDANYREDITLDTLCRVTEVNRTTLEGRFKKKFNVTMSEYLQNKRIKMACEILAHTNLSLSEIAGETGFRSDTYFIKRFTKLKGISPTAYRNDVRERAPGLSKPKSAGGQ